MKTSECKNKEGSDTSMLGVSSPELEEIDLASIQCFSIKE